MSDKRLQMDLLGSLRIEKMKADERCVCLCVYVFVASSSSHTRAHTCIRLYDIMAKVQRKKNTGEDVRSILEIQNKY
jgi:hypothetical protein